MAEMPSSEAWNALYGHQIVKNSKSLPDYEFWMLARTDFLPVTLKDDIGNAIRTVTPLNETFAEKITTKTTTDPIWKLSDSAKRVSRYIAYVLRYQAPIFFVFVGKNLLFNQYHGLEVADYYPPSLLVGTATDKEENEWREYLRNGFSETKKLLVDIKMDTCLDRIITAVGISFSVVDAEFAYLSAWKGIELLADDDFRNSASLFKRGVKSDEYDYFSQIMQKLFSGESVKLDTLDKVKTTLLRRIDYDNEDNIKKYYHLRNKIAHSTPDSVDYRSIVETLPELINLSAQVVHSALCAKDVDVA